MAVNVVEKIDGFVKVKHVIVIVSNKSGLQDFIPSLLKINPDVRIYSTGGTYGRIEQILGDRASSCLTQVSKYTGQPETQGGPPARPEKNLCSSHRHGGGEPLSL